MFDFCIYKPVHFWLNVCSLTKKRLTLTHGLCMMKNCLESSPYFYYRLLASFTLPDKNKTFLATDTEWDGQFINVVLCCNWVFQLFCLWIIHCTSKNNTADQLTGPDVVMYVTILWLFIDRKGLTRNKFHYVIQGPKSLWKYCAIT